MLIASLATISLAMMPNHDPAALARLYLGWRGGARLEQLAAVHAKSTIKLMGLNGTIERWTTSDGGEREDRDLKVFRVSEGNGPAGGWSLGAGGQVDRLSSAARTALEEDAAVDFGSALRGARAAVLSEPAAEVSAGRTWRVLRVSYATGAAYDLLIDGATGELGGERTVRDGRSTFVQFSDWRQVDGVRIAFREDADGALPGQTRHVAYSTIELNKPPREDTFTAPKPRRIAVFDPGIVSTGPMPIDIFDGRRIFVEAEVGGRRVAAMIDSGAAGSVMDTASAKKSGMRGSGIGSAIGVAGTAAVSMGAPADVRLGRLTLQALPLAVMDLSGVSSQIGHPLELVIGRDLFDQLVVTIDAQSRTITLADPAEFVPERRARSVTVQSEGPLRIVDARIEGGAQARLHFDLGNGTPLVLYPAYWRRRHLLEGRPSSKSLVGGVGGSVAADVIAARSLEFGGADFRNVPTLLMPSAGGAGDDSRVDGNLGFPVLSRFRLSIDNTHDRMWLVPLARTATRPFERDRSGLGIEAGQAGLTVELVAPASPASSAGLHTGDVIVAVDGTRVGPDYVASGLSRWRYGSDGRSVALTLSDGSTRTLKLADTY